MAALPHNLTPKQMEEGKALFTHEAKFVWGSTTPGSWPRTAFPEIAFVGRSNVGKSSLLNALTGQRGLAKVSKTPGRTQQFNFFNLADRFMLLDMPGYGYAKVGKKLEQMWAEMADHYFKTRDQLKRLFVLVDSRHGLKETDLMLMDWLNRLAVPYQIILTKIDKTTAAELADIQAKLSETLQLNAAATPEILLTSAEKREGIDILRGVIASLRHL
jgi:GTP-binding protein